MRNHIYQIRYPQLLHPTEPREPENPYDHGPRQTPRSTGLEHHPRDIPSYIFLRTHGRTSADKRVQGLRREDSFLQAVGPGRAHRLADGRISGRRVQIENDGPVEAFFVVTDVFKAIMFNCDVNLLSKALPPLLVVAVRQATGGSEDDGA